MKKTIWSVSAVLISVGLFNLGAGLQGTVLGVRASLEGFSPLTIGLIMSGFSMGYLAGSFYVPKFIYRVGHIRVFGTFTAIASSTILLHSIIIHPAVWIGIRLVSGFCSAGIAVVIESWLNQSSTNQIRGKILAIYMLIHMTATAGGQFLLNVADARGFVLFILVSALFSLASVPILITVTPTPCYEIAESLLIKDLFLISPLGVAGTLVVGVTYGVLLKMGMVYAQNIGLSIFQVSLFMTLAVLGGAVFQWPMGWLSDRLDRRWIIMCANFAAFFIGVAIMAFSEHSQRLLFILIFLLGGCSLPLYSLCVAHTNDYLNHKQVISANSGLILTVGIGLIIGPVSVGILMKIFGPSGFFILISLVHALLGVFALYRISIINPIPGGGQKPAIKLPIRSTPLVLKLTSEEQNASG